jgi:hypothetical protein
MLFQPLSDPGGGISGIQPDREGVVAGGRKPAEIDDRVMHIAGRGIGIADDAVPAIYVR